MLIRITDDMITLARRIEKTAKKYRPQYKDYGFDDDERFYTGAIGELVFVEALMQLGKKAYYKPTLIKADDGDIHLYHQNGKVIESIDVKTGSKPSYSKLLVPPTQAKKKIYIGVRLSGNLAEIMGFCYKRELYPMKAADHNLPVDALGMYYQELSLIDRIFNNLINGEVTKDLRNVLP